MVPDPWIFESWPEVLMGLIKKMDSGFSHHHSLVPASKAKEVRLAMSAGYR